jgi:hypothetical protein
MHETNNTAEIGHLELNDGLTLEVGWPVTHDDPFRHAEALQLLHFELSNVDIFSTGLV